MAAENQKVAHTPGPWRVGYKDDSGPECVTTGENHIASVVIGCGCCKSDRITDEEAANARLIAAAPDLLAALEAITHGPTTPGNNPETALDLARDVIHCAQKIARDAIAKAKGA